MVAHCELRVVLGNLEKHQNISFWAEKVAGYRLRQTNIQLAATKIKLTQIDHHFILYCQCGPCM